MVEGWSHSVPHVAIRWVYLTGDRFVLTLAGSALVMVAMGTLIGADIFYVGPGSSFPSIVYSGVLSGMLTLITVVLSINQLILSRLFGTAGGLMNDLEGSFEFRRTVEDIADVDASPNEPASFISLLGKTLRSRVQQLARDQERPDHTLQNNEVDEFVSDVTAYADDVSVADELDHPVKILVLTLGARYADDITPHVSSNEGTGIRSLRKSPVLSMTCYNS